MFSINNTFALNKLLLPHYLLFLANKHSVNSTRLLVKIEYWRNWWQVYGLVKLSQISIKSPTRFAHRVKIVKIVKIDNLGLSFWRSDLVSKCLYGGFNWLFAWQNASDLKLGLWVTDLWDSLELQSELCSPTTDLWDSLELQLELSSPTADLICKTNIMTLLNMTHTLNPWGTSFLCPLLNGYT